MNHAIFKYWRSENDGQWYWKLVAKNGEIISIGGEGFKEKASCLDSINVVKREVREARIEEGK